MSNQARFSQVVITGASGGIGLELARQLAARSDSLVLVARRKDVLDAIAAELSKAHPCKTSVISIDLEQHGSAEELWSKIKALGLSPDLWINNAGFGLYGDFTETALEREQAMVQLNVATLMTLTKLVLEPMKNAGRGTILNVASVAGFQPGPRMAVYFASKAFVLSFTEAIDEELKGAGVRVLVLCPGNTATAFHHVAGTERVKAMQKAFQMSPALVAKMAIRQIDRGQRIMLPGVLNRIMVFSSQILPRTFVTWVSGKVLKNN